MRCAYKLLIGALKQSATDENGLIDLQLLNVGKKVDLARIDACAKLVMHALQESGEIKLQKLVETLKVDVEVLQ